MPHRSSSDNPSSDDPNSDNPEFPEPAANFREQARMQASTASACLRKLSDCVNSVSKHHADSRSIMLSALFLRDFTASFCFSPARFAALSILTLTSTGLVPQISPAVETFPQF